MTTYTTKPDPVWPDTHTAIYKGNRRIASAPHDKVQERIDHHERITQEHWSEIATRTDDRLVIANGTAYSIGSPDDNPRGFGGSVWLIRFHDGRDVRCNSLWCLGDIPADWRDVRCNSLWCLGDIPADWRDRLPDNATLKEIGHDPQR
jgi:hypothetical protein